MLITRNVKLTSSILASRPPRGAGGRREFDRLPSPPGAPLRLKTYLERWNWAFLEARDSLGLGDVSVAVIMPAAYFEVKTTSTYNRTYGSAREKEAFENIPSGSVLAWRFTLSHHLPPHAEEHSRFVRVPSEEEFDSMLAHIGEHLGMSFWGHDYLYGRFTLHNPPVSPTTP